MSRGDGVSEYAESYCVSYRGCVGESKGIGESGSLGGGE
jgi:hypothetical protein